MFPESNNNSIFVLLEETDMPSHQELSDYIKKVHIDLRLRSRNIGTVSAWQEHCQDQPTLEKYASAMRELASVHWEQNNSERSDLSRNMWTLKQSEWYFFNDGERLLYAKEGKLAAKHSLQFDVLEVEHKPQDTISLLDVGSCYNPLAKFPQFKVTAIDLAPASTEVLKCDFLSVAIGDELLLDGDKCLQLAKEGFDSVLFSLLLEYLPSAEQRYEACRKAERLLRPGGLLLIVTPDSNHASANSRLVRLWRCALASLGFLLLTTEKLKHLRCFAFAKSHDSRLPNSWLKRQRIHLSLSRAIIIPQDKNPYNHMTIAQKEIIRSESDNKNIAEIFSYMISQDDLFV